MAAPFNSPGERTNTTGEHCITACCCPSLLQPNRLVAAACGFSNGRTLTDNPNLGTEKHQDRQVICTYRAAQQRNQSERFPSE